MTMAMPAARLAGVPARAPTVDTAASARVPTRVRRDREPMPIGDDRPELAFCAASRQRLVRQLLQAEMTRSEHGRTPGDAPSPTITPPDRHQEPT